MNWEQGGLTLGEREQLLALADEPEVSGEARMLLARIDWERERP